MTTRNNTWWRWAMWGTIALLSLGVGCKVKDLTIPAADSIASLKFVMKLVLIPDIVDINSQQTSRSRLRVKFTDWKGNPMAGERVLFSAGSITGVPFTVTAIVTRTVEQSVEVQSCDITGSTCTTVSCNNQPSSGPCGFVTIESSTSTDTAVCTDDQAGVIQGSSLGDIRPRWGVTSGSGIAEATFIPWKLQKVITLVTGNLTPYAVACLAAPETPGVTVDQQIDEQEIDTDGDGTNDALRRTITTTRTTVTVQHPIIGLLISTFDVPIQVEWRNPEFLGQVYDIQILRVQVPQWWHD